MEIRLIPLQITPLPILAAIFTFLLVLAGCSQDTDTPASRNLPDVTFIPSTFGNITRERLLNADNEPGQWLTEGRDFGKGHYSPLDQINIDNVNDLGFGWEYRTGTSRGMEANPIVVDGVLYTSPVRTGSFAVWAT